MPGAPTLQDVAARAGVSTQTVSNALNAPHKLRAETLRQVLAVIEELGYRPHTSARGLRTRSSGLIGYCAAGRRPGNVNAFMDEFLHALTYEVERTGRHVLLFTAPPGQQCLPVYEDLLARSAVDAFVLSETQVDDCRHGWLADRGVPFVSFGRTWTAAQPGRWVDVDGANGIGQAVRHLVTAGHRRIGFVGLPEGNPVGVDRARGWRDACRDAGLDACDELTLHASEEDGDGRRWIRRYLDLPERPTALVAATDALALSVYSALAAHGIRPGVDVAVTGFDDSPSAAVVDPGLTSVRQPIARIAARLIELLDAVDGNDGGELFQPELVIRASSTAFRSP
jgi:DNA-binding LacI/PurR family transcriptional regulator